MLWSAYMGALVLGLALAVFLGPWPERPPRSMLLPAIVLCALAASYEAMVPATMNIRLDLLLVIPLLCLVHAATGVALGVHAAKSRRAGRPSWASAIPALLCLGAATWIVVAWVVSDVELRRTTARFDEGHELAFQAAFRDDVTQRRFFGDLSGDADGWAGYYVPARSDTYPRRIVINATGKYWVFGDHDYSQPGQRQETEERRDVFVGKGVRGAVATGIRLARKSPDNVVLQRSWDGKLYEYAYVKQAPPRFPLPASPEDRVTFRGVFSGAAGSERDIRVAQIWIWEADGRLWGKYLWQGFTRGSEQQVVAQRDARIKCADTDCRIITVQVEKEATARLTWLSGNALRLDSYEGGKIVLERGEMVPGFVYDLAPLATREQNQRWLERVEGGSVWWTPPPAATAGSR